MGQSTDAILAWGIQFEEKKAIPWEEAAERAGYDDPLDDDAMAYLLCGLDKPKASYKDDAEVHREYWDAKRAALKECPVELISHCSGEYPMYMLAISSSEKKARRGYPQAIDPNFLEIQDGWLEEFVEACKKLGIENPEPKWWLQSDWC